MTDLEKLQQWLATYPKWNEGRLHVEYTDALPGNLGLYPAGLEEVSRREDVLGNVTANNRYHFVLYRVAAGQEKNEENAQWLLEFQNWVQSQSAAGLAPRFGDEPKSERLRAEKRQIAKGFPNRDRNLCGGAVCGICKILLMEE